MILPTPGHSLPPAQLLCGEIDLRSKSAPDTWQGWHRQKACLPLANLSEWTGPVFQDHPTVSQVVDERELPALLLVNGFDSKFSGLLSKVAEVFPQVPRQVKAGEPESV